MGRVPPGATPLGPGAVEPLVEAALIFPRGGAGARQKHGNATPSLAAARYSHVEYAGNAQRPGVPACLILLQGGMQRVCKFANDRNGPLWTGEAPLLFAICQLLKRQHGSDDGQDGEERPSRRSVLERRQGEVRQIRRDFAPYRGRLENAERSPRGRGAHSRCIRA